MATLTIDSITCSDSSNWVSDDVVELRIDGQTVWSGTLARGQTVYPGSTRTIGSTAQVSLVETDWLDDTLGTTLVYGDQEVYSKAVSFTGGGGQYTLTYTVTLTAYENPDGIPIDCPEDDPDDGSGCEGPDYGIPDGICDPDDPVQPCPLGRLGVFVCDPNGAPIQGATVEVCPLGLSLTTKADGVADFLDVPEGDYTVRTWKQEWLPDPDEQCVTVIATQSSAVTVMLTELAMEFASDDTAGAFINPVAQYFPFLIGQNRVISVRIKAAPPDAIVEWTATPIGVGSGTINPGRAQGARWDFTPAVNNAQRPATASRRANDPVAYDVVLRLTFRGQTASKTQRISQDTADIIRQEYVDFHMQQQFWYQPDPARPGQWVRFNLPIPQRNQIVAPNPPQLNGGNYNLVLDAGMGQMFQAVQAAVPAALNGVSSGWRNPRRNLVPNGHPNSHHQEGRAVDMTPVGNAGTAARRANLLAIYNAALAAGGAEVLLEQNTVQLIRPANWAIPAPGPGAPDNDGDGLPDNQANGGVNLRNLFDQATHVHGAM